MHVGRRFNWGRITENVLPTRPSRAHDRPASASPSSNSSSSGAVNSSKGRSRPLHLPEAFAKAQVATAQGHLCIHTQVSAQIHYGKQQIAQLRLNRRFAAGSSDAASASNSRSLQPAWQQFAPLRPVEAAFRARAPNLAASASAGIARCMYPISTPEASAPKSVRYMQCLFGCLDLFPVPQQQPRRTSTAASTSPVSGCREASSPKTWGCRRTSLLFR